MPKSKHRRKAGEKAVPHPGRGRPGRPLFDNAAVMEGEEAGALPPVRPAEGHSRPAAIRRPDQ
jgi:hypothetical protein